VGEGVGEESALKKIAPSMRQLAQDGGKAMVPVVVEVEAGVDLSGYLSGLLARPFVFRGNVMVYGTARAGDLLSIASMPEVLAVGSHDLAPDRIVVDSPFAPDREVDDDLRRAQLDAMRAIDVPFAEAPPAKVNTEGWFDVQDGHKSSYAWEKGFTGEGVVVAVIDDGIDFGHPDLVGTVARVHDPESPYYGWPMAFSEVSVYYFAVDVLDGTSYTRNGGYGIWNADTSETRDVIGNFDGTATIAYTPLAGYNSWSVEHEYTIPATSLSHVAHIGSFPDVDLEQLYGERVAVLVMDESAAGVYDTVYVDLDNDYDFTDEKPARLGDEYIYRDMDGDGYADISGGMVQWISDGDHTLPVADWLWGIGCGDEVGALAACPDSGDLVMFTGAYDYGYTHGTNSASNVAGQGVVGGGLTATPHLTC
jgi:subtilisin family serine protease